MAPAYREEADRLKIAEKLVILNGRAVGLLTRIYNIKKACAEPKSKPTFLGDKTMESAIKHIVKKFPVIDLRSNQSTFSNVANQKEEIVKSLSLYYYTFVDLLEFKEHTLQFLTTMDVARCHLDITLNYELTAGYLNLITNFISLMILLSRVDDRKAVLGIFNAAYDLSNGHGDYSFPRLGQMIIDYENPWRKLSEELGPLNRLIHSAIHSLCAVYHRRNVTAEMWRSAQILSLSANSQQLLYAAQTDTIACEYLSLDVMDRWIILPSIVCHNFLLSDALILRMWTLALQMGLALRIFRDEILLLHPTILGFFEGNKGLGKRIQEVKEAHAVALQQSPAIHADRRRFLRSALRELLYFFRDEPGLLGPKILFVWMGLSFSRDEVLWLIRHSEIWPSSKKTGSSAKAGDKTEELSDKQLPELLYYIEELRDLVRKHAQVIQRYHEQYVVSYDAIALGELLDQARTKGLQNDEAQLLQSFVRDISLPGSLVEQMLALRAKRLDWFRFQALTSMAKFSFDLSLCRPLADMMNTTVFHLRMIDQQEEMLKETSDLSIYCFYVRTLERHWRQCLSLPTSCRYTLAFARLCSHFASSLHEMCPEEKSHVIERSLAMCNSVLDELCETIGGVIIHLWEHELQLADQTSATQVAQQIVSQVLRDRVKASKSSANLPQTDFILAGEESQRLDRHELTYQDRRQTTLIELCCAISSVKQVVVAEHIFAPREYLYQHLENRFSEMVIRAVSEDGSTPRRPSQLLTIIYSYMTVLQNLDAAVTIDVTRLFSSVLLQQTQPVDGRNRETITAIYTKWYLEVVLRRAATGQMVWSDHLQAMIGNGENNVFAPEQYTDPSEMRALVQILGPYGVKHLSERLIWHVASQIGELNKLVISNKEILLLARSHFDQADKMREVASVLSFEPKDSKKNPGAISSTTDAILQRTSIIGQIFSFRDAIHHALRHVLARRLPFLISSYRNLYESVCDDTKVIMAELGASMGEETLVDTALVNAVRAQTNSISPEEHYQISCLLMVAIAISLPRLADMSMSIYKPSIQAALNNSHCVPLAISTLGSALFQLHGKKDIIQRMKEFLALASSAILRCGHESDVTGGEKRPLNFLAILLDQIVTKSRYLTADVLETCFPYTLVRTAYLECYHKELTFVNS
ncbi:unnamed protein product, partial [Mesorhabditis belari]|uniref:Uncharacterized protein n=1 Tax=Mesorhabditis belari TaxID=2138241 RepID=A0AAF3EAD5_9BILA